MNNKGLFPIIAILIFGLFALYYGASSLGVPSQASFLLVGAIVLWLVVARPLWGIIFYLLYLPFVRDSAGLGADEFMALGLLVLICVIWFISRSKKWSHVLEISRIERSLVILFLYLIFSILVGQLNGVKIIDWARDLFPIMNLVLILPIVHFIDNEKEFQLVFKMFIIVMAIPIFQWFFKSLISVGLLSYFDIHYLSGTPFAMYILMILAIASLVESRKIILLHIVPAIAAIGTALLNRQRTVWVGISLSMFVIFFITKHKVKWLTVVLVFILSVGVFISYLAVKRSYVIERQMGWVMTFSSLDEDLSWQSRMAERKATLAIFYKHPLLGIGLGYQYYFWRPFVKGIGPGYMTTNMTHSDETNYLAKTGLIGVGLLLFLFYNVVYLGIKFYRRTNDPECRMIYLLGTCSTIIAVIVANSTPILQIRYNASALAFVIAFIFVKKKLEHKKLESHNNEPG
ncbi:MAG: O-antigen ligase family protein [bacterium]